MPTVSRRHRLAWPFVVCACAIVVACGHSQSDEQTGDARSSASASVSVNAAPQAIQSNELQDWARQATTGITANASATPKADIAHVSSEPLAPPVIHTVD
jgi:hypothetical protein